MFNRKIILFILSVIFSIFTFFAYHSGENSTHTLLNTIIDNHSIDINGSFEFNLLSISWLFFLLVSCLLWLLFIITLFKQFK
jgi:hypothetical protein